MGMPARGLIAVPRAMHDSLLHGMIVFAGALRGGGPAVGCLVDRPRTVRLD